MTQIVTVNVTQLQAPTPPTLQQTGALVSQGGTILAPGETSLLTQFNDLTPLIRGGQAIASIAWAATVVTVTTSLPHGYTIGDTLELTITGFTPTGWNGTFLVTVTDATHFTYNLPTNPGSATALGVYTPEDVAELVAMVTTFFTQGIQIGVFVLELGPGNAADGVTALHTYLINNDNRNYTPGAEGFFYIYVVPRSWSYESTFIALIANYESTTAKTYFFVTAFLDNYTSFTDLMKDVVLMIEAPQTSAYATQSLTDITYNTGDEATSATVAVDQAGAGSYAPGDVLTVVGGTGTEPTFTVVHTVVAQPSITINAVGSGGTPGSATFTGTTGTGTKFTFTAVVAGDGTLTGATPVFVQGGSYTVNPTSLTSEPITGGGVTGATVTIKMGVLDVSLTTAGAMTVIPANPVVTTTGGTGTGATLNVTWLLGPDGAFIIAHTVANHGVHVGDWFQIQGVTPLAYNGWYQAITGTAATELVAKFYGPDPGVETLLGSLVGSPRANSAIPVTEFSIAAAAWVALHYKPSSTNKVPPYAFSFIFGVTPFPTHGNNPLLATFKTLGINVVSTGAEGGITNTILLWGTTMDVRDFTYWYSIDWAQLNSDFNLTNAIINGSNDPVNPLYYSQDGINRLQDVVVNTMNSAITVGLANGRVTRVSLNALDFIAGLDAGNFAGQIVVNAVPLIPYLQANPGDYKIGEYDGLSVAYIPNRGFVHIVLSILVSDFLVP